MYVGRFAPSPTGPLHFGSLVAALASYLDAKANKGTWLVRIEDLDAQRCRDAHASSILSTLALHGMNSDVPVLYQTSRLAIYQNKVDDMLQHQAAYFCKCTRKQIRANGGAYLGVCRDKHLKEGAIRFYNRNPVRRFHDRFKLNVHVDDPHALEDFTLLRKDKIFAYNLAVVIDDIDQGVNHVVRGDDLLETTSAHLSLYNYLNEQPPKFAHIDVIRDKSGHKLSKQNRAPAICNTASKSNIVDACAALGIPISVVGSSLSIAEILAKATVAWKHYISSCGNNKQTLG